MPDPGYFTKLRSFLLGGRERRARRRTRPSYSPSSPPASLYNLEPLEARLLLAADLAGAVQTTQVIDPIVPQQAAISLLETEQGSEANNFDMTAPADTARLDAAYGKLPYSFEANQGQTDGEVSYLAHGDGYSLFLTGDGATLSLQQDDGSAPAVLTMEMIGANPEAIITGEQLLPGVANYFIGNDASQWRTEIPTYAQVQYDEIYAGIDLLYYGKQGQLEYDFVVAPGADPGTIQLRFTGADQLSLNEQGDLLLQVGSEQLTVQRPVLYQLVDGNRQEISGSFVLNESGTVGFQVGAYDPSQLLVIDPVLVYSTYVGGSNGDRSNSVEVDGAGQAYITGQTASFIFPLVNSIQNQWDSEGQAFVTKLNATGTAVLYSTHIGGTGFDEGFEIALDAAGNIYVGGSTSATNFPTTSGAFQQTRGGGIDGFLTKLNPTGSALLYSTYLGGSDFDQVNGIAVDAAGRVYAVGQTASGNYPTTPGAFQTANAGNPGSFDAFVTSLNASGSALLYSTYLGGTQTDLGNAIALDVTGQAYVTGFTSSTPVGGGRTGAFPTTPGAFDEIGPQFGIWQPENAFVTKLNPAGTSLVYSTILGGTSLDVGNGIAIDSSGHAYVAGATDSFNFPITSGAFQTSGSVHPSDHRDRSGFVTKLNPTGSGLVYSSYLNGSSRDELNAVVLDTEGNTYVTGFTGSTNYPITPDALQAGHGSGAIGGPDAIVTVLNPTGSALVYSSYLGGNEVDSGRAIARDSAGSVYVAGLTGSSNFPTTNPSFQASPPGQGDAFVTKIGFAQPNRAPVANPDSYSVNEDTTLTVPTLGLLTNDTDADNNLLIAALVSGPTNGVLTLNADGSFTYTPTANFSGSDSFTYKANDGTADSNVATVSISVAAVNDLPTAVNDTATVAEDSGATAIGVLANDSFAPDLNETLTITAVTQGANGAVVMTGNGTGLTYAPNANFFGPDSFTYTISDGSGGTATATVSMTVTPVNDAPTANAGPDQPVSGGTLLTDTLVTLDGTGSSDVEGHTPLTFAWTLLTKPAGSTASLVNPTSSGPTFTPDVVGAYTVQLVVTDALGMSSAPDTVQVSATTLAVGIDIRPGGSPNNINLGSGGVVQVAILSTNTFNSPREVDPVSVTLASASVRLSGNGTPTTTVRDVNGDGLDDLIVHVNTEALQLSESDTQATLDGKTFGGISIRGTDSIRVVP